MASTQDCKIGWQGGQQVYKPVEAENVSRWAVNDNNSKNVFYRKDDRYDPLRRIKFPVILVTHSRNALKHHQDNTQNNDYK